MTEKRKQPEMAPGDIIGGYRLNRVVALEEIRGVFYEFVHSATGARHIHIATSDTENTFGVIFKTVPADSSGVAHILEHTVLCGSRRFPVRDPFFSMLKRSLSTFMNAFTSADWTMYPFCTQNQKDFYNLMAVYLDAVFYPNLNRLSFKQEGHRLEIEGDPDDASVKLAYKGVVYNEMKGAMSSPHQVMERSLLAALYPDTTYRYNSGGEPSEIPGLTHEQLKAFHARHYHPSNAYFYTYGNLPVKDHLAFIEANVLKNFGQIDPQTEVASQPRWKNPRKVSDAYALAEDEDPAKKFQACVAWLTDDIRESFEILALALLEEILLGNAASPLRKGLITSGLGSALSDGSGFSADQKETLFACGLKDVEASAAPKVEAIVFEVLEKLVADGIDRELVESAIHQLEFHRKEITNTPYPYGIKLLLSFCETWLHGGDPLRILRFEHDLERLRQELDQGPFFEKRIENRFLKNPHRVRFTLVPDQTLAETENRRIAKELERIRKGLSREKLARIQKEAQALKVLQDSQEDVSTLPTLEIADIPPEVQTVNPDPARPGVPALVFQQATSGIFYFCGATGVTAVPKALVPLVPLFAYVLPKIGTAKHDYSEMAQMIAAYTGGMGLGANSRTAFNGEGTPLPFVSLNGKCLVRNCEKMKEIIEEILCDADFSDLARLKSLVREYRANMEAAVVQNGHRLAISLASRNFSPAATLSELWGGVHQLKAVKGLSRDLSDAGLKRLASDLSTIGRHIVSAGNFQFAMIGEQEALKAGESFFAQQSGFSDLVQRGEAATPFSLPDIDLSHEFPQEGWSTSSAVSFVAQVFKTVRMGHEMSSTLTVVSKMLRSLYLHREIREKGGAYGGFAIYNPETGLFAFGSYRDPHVVQTLNVYAGAAEFIKSGRYKETDIKEAILQVCAEIDRPDPPGPAARKAFYRRMIGLSDEKRKRFKEDLLKTDRRMIQEAAEAYFEQPLSRQGVVVISGEAQLKVANEKLAENRLSLHKI